MARQTGIRKRHTDDCRTRDGGRCSCNAGYEASVWSARDGRKIRQTFPTEAAAIRWRADAVSAVARGGLRAPTPTTIREAAVALFAGMRDGTIRNRSGKRYKPSAIRSYEQAFELHLLADFGAAKLSELRVEHVQRKVDEMLAAGASPSTIRNALMPLRVIYRRACRPGGEVLVNPTRGLELPALAGGRDRVASPEEAETLIGYLPRLFDRTLWAVAFYAGLRLGELMALRWDDVDLAAGVIRVERSYDDDDRTFGEPKSASGIRKVPIAGVLRDYLLAWKLAAPIGAELVFPRDDGRPLNASAARSRAQRAWLAVDDQPCSATTAAGKPCQAVALRGFSYCVVHRAQEPPAAKRREPTVQPIGFHEARHTFASLMIAAGVNVKALSTFMGHASVAITLDRYGHLLPGGESEAAALMDAFLERANTQARLAELVGSRAPVVRRSDTEMGGLERISADDAQEAI